MLRVHFVSSISLIGLLITGNTPYTNLHFKITWQFHPLHIVAIHLLMGVSHQDLITSVPHGLPSLPVRFQVSCYTLVQVCVPLNGLVPWYPKKTPLPSCVTRRLRSAEGDENCNLLPKLSHQNVGWLVDRSQSKAGLFFKGKRKNGLHWLIRGLRMLGGWKWKLF